MPAGLPGCARRPRRPRGRARYRRSRCGSPSTTRLHPLSGLQSRQPWSSQSPCYMKLFTIFGFGADLRREMSTKSNGNPAAVGQRGRSWGRNVGVGYRDLAAGADGARLFQRLLQAEAAADRRRRRHPAVRARASAPRRAVPAEPVARNHAAISRPGDPRAEALEIRSDLDGRGMPAGGHVAARPIDLPA